MALTTLYEPAHSDGLTTRGTGEFYLTESLAQRVAISQSKAHATTPLRHLAVCDEGVYYLLKDAKPIRLGNDKTRRERCEAILAKLTIEEREIVKAHYQHTEI